MKCNWINLLFPSRSDCPSSPQRFHSLRSTPGVAQWKTNTHLTSCNYYNYLNQRQCLCFFHKEYIRQSCQSNSMSNCFITFLEKTNKIRNVITCWICWASSRVGASTSTIGPSSLNSLGWLMMWTMAGRIYAKVLPEPVWAIPTKSRPERAIGHPWAWMGVGCGNPCFKISFMA